MMGCRAFLAYFACLVFLAIGVSAQSNTDVFGLQAFYNALSNPEVLTDWDFTNPTEACSWTGVSCSSGFVTKLTLTGYGLSGTLSPNVSSMSHLQVLNIQTNSFSGTVPNEIYNMKSMVQLNLAQNSFTGNFPTSLMGMPILQKIYWNNNGQLTGNLPSDVAGLNATLNYFSIGSCNVIGTIPDAYGSLTLLQSFLINVNHITGTIPASLGNLVNVQNFKIGSNQLSGTIPDTLGNLRSVQLFHLYSNSLSGTIPASLGNMAAVQEMHLYQNTALTGSIPESFVGLRTLTSLQIHKCAITGSIPLNIGNLNSLQTLSLYQNKMQGSIPLSVIGLGNLTTLAIYTNQLMGTLPPGLGQLTKLSVISISGNEFFGPFPSFWQTQPSAQYISLSSNCWNASIPAWVTSKGYAANSNCNTVLCGDSVCTAAETCHVCPHDCISPCDPIEKTQACNDTVNGGCDPLTDCVDTTYSVYCTACPYGYSGAGLTGCVDIDECTTTDVQYEDDCDPLMTCVNLPGNYTCEGCPAGVTIQVGHVCEDVNECNFNNGGCSQDRECINLIKTGSLCGNCSAGKVPIGNASCSDANPCAVSGLNPCSPNALCTPLNGTNVNCTCKLGYVSPDGTGYECDVDEDYIRQNHKFDKGLSGGLGAVVGAGVIIAIFATIMLGMFWSNFARHGSFYCGIIIGGVFLSYVSALTILPHHTDALCVAMPWFLGVAFTLVYGCLFIKTWALYKVWRNATNFKKTTLTPFYIIKLLACELAVEIIFLIIWTVVDPPKVHYRKMVDDTWAPACQSKSSAWWAVFLCVKGAWLLFGAVLSVLTRDVAKEYNESSSIAYATYNNVTLAIIAVPLALVLRDVNGGVEIIEVAIITIAFTFTMCILFFEIWYRIFFPDKNIVESKLGPRATNSSTASTTARTATSARATQSSHSASDSASAGVV